MSFLSIRYSLRLNRVYLCLPVNGTVLLMRHCSTINDTMRLRSILSEIYPSNQHTMKELIGLLDKDSLFYLINSTHTLHHALKDETYSEHIGTIKAVIATMPSIVDMLVGSILHGKDNTLNSTVKRLNVNALLSLVGCISAYSFSDQGKLTELMSATMDAVLLNIHHANVHSLYNATYHLNCNNYTKEALLVLQCGSHIIESNMQQLKFEDIKVMYGLAKSLNFTSKSLYKACDEALLEKLSPIAKVAPLSGYIAGFNSYMGLLNWYSRLNTMPSDPTFAFSTKFAYENGKILGESDHAGLVHQISACLSNLSQIKANRPPKAIRTFIYRC